MSAQSEVKNGNRKQRKKKKNPWPILRITVTAGFLILISSNWVVGSTSYMSIGPLQIACPLGVAQVLLATRRVIPYLISASVLGFLLIVLFGRFFCGWICPGRYVFNRKPKGKELSLKTRNWLRGGILGGVLALSTVCHNPLFCMICPAGVACRGAIAMGTGGSILPTVGWLGMVAGIEHLTFRSWCKDLCPLGFVNQVLSRLNPFIKLRTTDACVPCNACERVCPENINLSLVEQNQHCTKCMECLHVCPRNAVVIKLIDVEGM